LTELYTTASLEDVMKINALLDMRQDMERYMYEKEMKKNK